ncbi:hypothetical protein E5288_WYG005108 [Bos mutus]|uniref:Uncharacterized protein n=1 Tax=Bos mutus TaxID=72004 RepID=A0A6B0RYS8_9CETA|nr:hypothetical protein [Bos mutus]
MCEGPCPTDPAQESVPGLAQTVGASLDPGAVPLSASRPGLTHPVYSMRHDNTLQTPRNTEKDDNKPGKRTCDPGETG